VFLKDVATILDFRHPQHLLEEAAHANRALMSNHVAYLMSDNPGELVFRLSKSYELSRYVDSAAGQHKRIGLRQIDQREPELQLVRRQVLDDPVSYPAQMGSHLLVFDNPVLMLDVLCNRVAQIDFLLIGKDVSLTRRGEDLRRLARL